MTKYHARLERNTVEYRSDLGGMAEEILSYTLTADDSELDVDFRFRNQTLSRYRLNVIEGTPLYIYPQPTNILDVADGLLQRYQNYAGVSYLATMRNMLKTVNETEDVDITVGDMKFIIVTEGNDVMMQWSHMSNGIDYQGKGVRLTFDNGILEMFNDGFFLFNVGSTEVNISEEEAINIAINGAKDFSWTVGGVEIKDFIILEETVSVELWPHMKDEPAALVPYWYVTFKLDKTYPGNINSLGVGIWADTGEISAFTTISAG
jgi:hypothetical protein